MQNTKLKSSHKRLTFLFTGIVFFVLIIFGISILTTKYYREQTKEKREFETATQRVVSSLSKGDKILPHISGEQKERLQNYIQTVSQVREDDKRFFVSFFILDEDHRISFENMVERPTFEKLVLDKGDVFYIDDDSMVRVVPLRKSILGEKIIFYKHLRYSKEDFMYDVLLFFFFSSFLAVALYFIGYKFVGRALKPVEENLQDMSDFIHNAGHELKTPLAVMRGNLQIMQAEKKFDKSLLERSIGEVDHMNGLIESLRELSELGILSEKENLKLVWEIENVRQEFDEMLLEKNIEFLGLTSEKPEVFANKHELQLLLSNIIKNAIKYTPAGGKIEIQYKKSTLSISDTGIGISKKEQEKIFERFYQSVDARSGEGYGIGLSLVRKIADANGWKLSLESKKGKGTTFYITF